MRSCVSQKQQSDMPIIFQLITTLFTQKSVVKSMVSTGGEKAI